MNLRQSYQDILVRVARAADLARCKEINIVAVSKKQPFCKIQELYGLGHRDFGENYVQELKKKAEEARRQGMKEIRWHLIGHLQTNKVKQVLQDVSSIHTLDSQKLLEEIHKRASSARPVEVFIQVNIDAEKNKGGVSPEGVGDLVRSSLMCPSVRLKGLMCIPALDQAETGTAFKRMKQLAKQIEQDFGVSLGLSMGMTGDFEVAIAHGATMVRIGSAIFGDRNFNEG